MDPSKPIQISVLQVTFTVTEEQRFTIELLPVLIHSEAPLVPPFLEESDNGWRNIGMTD